MQNTSVLAKNYDLLAFRNIPCCDLIYYREGTIRIVVTTGR